MKYGRYPPHRIRDRANLFAPPLQSKNTPTNRRVPFVRDDFTFYSWLVRNSNSSAIFFTDAISAVNASYGDAAPFARYLRSFRCANRKQESIRSISNLSVKFSRNFCKLFTNTTTTKWWRTRRCYEAGPMNFLIYRPWKQIIGDCACARREKSPECGGEGGKWRRRRRGSEKGRRSRDLSISRGQGNFLNYIALIGLTASLLFPRSIFLLSDRGLPASRPLGLSLRNPSPDPPMETSRWNLRFPRKERGGTRWNDSIATIKFLGRDPRHPSAIFSDRMTIGRSFVSPRVVRAITVVKNFSERLVIERGRAFSASISYISNEKTFRSIPTILFYRPSITFLLFMHLLYAGISVTANETGRTRV